MKLKEVAVISGKPGLYQILKPTRNGVIIEAIGGGRSKIMADASHRISILKEISIYTTTEEGSVPLQDVFYKMFEKFALKIDIKTSDNNALKGLLDDILPEWDKDRVYTSDIKKLVMWYDILTQHAPELIDPTQKEEEEEEQTLVATQEEKEAEETLVEEETPTKEEKSKKKSSKKTAEEKEAKLKKKAAKKTDKPSAKTQKPTSKAATKAVKGKRGDK
ncbi:hypothetical protein Fleli_2716 [Bernardetia litoralis DSM 6794]|uniref:Uncharacterized protein n=1 Tax=Bernardetia litoralis (strain ATCC 23117 / DSM 6794 / NBRC 15988 / NCIMB 1366 / Fx l1 / Sio-4) TaxID=880071 RepID=I4AM86_BERLS|nr:DUF5606 domain-containing protein [Bernardetia litoralis]AFM05071.1 hypothetical protein Fleli_2716 [Bernardetia litoralis DSM 6794]